MLPQSTQLLTEKSHRKRQPVASSEISHTFGLQRNNSFHHGFLTKTLGLVSGAVLAAGTFFGAFGVAPHAAEAIDFTRSTNQVSAAGTYNPQSTQWYATSFTTGSDWSQYTLTSVKLFLVNTDGNPFAVNIFSNISSQPGASIVVTGAVNVADSLTDATATASFSGVTFTPNTTYWVVLQGNSASNGNTVSYTTSPGSTGSTGWSIGTKVLNYDTGTSTWTEVGTGQSIMMEVAAASSGVPIPFEFSPVGGVAILATKRKPRTLFVYKNE